MAQKQCRICGVLKELDHFHSAAGMKDGHRNECKSCHAELAAKRYRENPEFRSRAKERARAWQQRNAQRVADYQAEYRAREGHAEYVRAGHLQRTFGITPAEYDARLARQGGGCRICGSPPPEGKSLHVDHDHETGFIRGLLCFRCNAAIGQMDDDPDRLRLAADYVGVHRRLHALIAMRTDHSDG